MALDGPGGRIGAGDRVRATRFDSGPGTVRRVVAGSAFVTWDDSARGTEHPIALHGLERLEPARRSDSERSGPGDDGRSFAGGATIVPGGGADAAPQLPPLGFIGDIDFAAIPRTEWLYKRWIARGYTSLTIAAPKVGKSALALIEAVDAASGGRAFGTGNQPKRKTLYFNAEDDLDVLHNRVAAICLHYGIEQSEIAATLAVESGVAWPDFFLMGQTAEGAQINRHVFDHLAERIAAGGFEILTFDPMQDFNHADETNESFRALGRFLRTFAREHGVGVHNVHHTRKVAHGVTPTIDDARGGSALRGTSRFNRVLVAMSPEEAVSAGVDDHRYFFRIGDVEQNLAPPSSEANRWFRKVSVLCPNGEDVVAVARWHWPDAFDHITVDMACEVRRAVGEMDPPARKDPQAADWVGNLVMRVCDFTPPAGADERQTKAAKERAKRLVDEWIKTDVLAVGEWHDHRNGRPTKIIVPGSNDPRRVDP